MILAEVASRRLRGLPRWAPTGLAAGMVAGVWLIAGRIAYLGTHGLPVPVWDGGLSPVWGALAASLVAALWMARGTSVFRPFAAVAIVALVTGGPGLLAPPIGDGTRLDGLEVTSLGGEVIALDDRQGRPLVLNLWASWCGPCRAEMPMMQRVAADRPEVEFIFVNQAEAPGTVGTFLVTENLSAAGVVMDPDRVTARRYGGIGLPTTVFFSADGVMRSVYVGEIPEDALMSRIDMILQPE